MIDSAMETNLCVIAGGGILPRKIAEIIKEIKVFGKEGLLIL